MLIRLLQTQIMQDKRAERRDNGEKKPRRKERRVKTIKEQ